MRDPRPLRQGAVLVLLLFVVIAADYGIFLYRQRHGDVLSFTHVKQYIAVNDGNGHYHYEYFGEVDIPCVVALLPHQQMSPCWWVDVHRDHYL